MTPGSHQKTPSEELEADEFARELLISVPILRKFVAASEFEMQSVKAFAGQLGIAPGIVVGRLQRDKIRAPNQLNRLKRRVVWQRPKATGQ